MRIPRSLALFALATVGLGITAFAPADTASWSNVDRIVAIGDVHGEFDGLTRLLKNAGIIDADHRWIAGKTHFVSVGDLVDRGPASRNVMDLFMALQPQADAAGGHVHVLLGNHEVMNLLGDLRDVSSEEYAAFANSDLDSTENEAPPGFVGHRRAFAPNGHYGAWLLQRPALIRINKTVFVHGGLPKIVAKTGIAEANKRIHTTVHAMLATAAELEEETLIPPHANLPALVEDWREMPPDNIASERVGGMIALGSDPLLNDIGPLWYRGTASCHPLVEVSHLQNTLKTLDATRVVMGHTPTADRQINVRFSGSAYVVDTGMLNRIYKGKPFALELTADEVGVINEHGERVPATYPDLPDDTAALAALDTLAQDPSSLKPSANPNGKKRLTVEHAVGTLAFTPMKLRDANKATAAYRLDRWLGLGMVPVTRTTQVHRRHGILQHLPGRYVTETQRQAGGQVRPNWCEQGNDYQPMQVFDALVNQHKRTTDFIAYNARSWQIRLTGRENAFRATSQLPTTPVAPQLPAAMASRLRELNDEVLQTLVGELLTPREISHVLKRRDRILAWSE